MPPFDPVLHAPFKKGRIAGNGELTIGPSLEEGHPDGDGRHDPEPSEGGRGHNLQGKQVHSPISEHGNQDRDGPRPVGRPLSIESCGHALEPDPSRREEPEQYSDRKSDTDDRRKEDQFRPPHRLGDPEENEQADQERSTHGRADGESGDQPQPIALLNPSHRRLSEDKKTWYEDVR